MDLLKEIGAILGFVAFAGMTVLAFLTFQQARHVRRLREWAGRSPERAAVEAERFVGAPLPGRPGAEREPVDTGPGRWERLRGSFAYRYEELDRRSPVDPRVLAAALLAVIVGVGILTSGFGLLSSSGETPTAQAPPTGGKEQEKKDKPAKVTVLNGTAPEGGVGVAGIAETASGFVKDAGFRIDGVADASAPFPTSIVMYKPGADAEAQQLAGDLEPSLGVTEAQEITPEVEDLAGRADVVLIVGQDDQTIG